MNPSIKRLLLLAGVAAGLFVAVVLIVAVVGHVINNSGATLTLAPALSTCILAPGMGAALVLSALLYREQRRMAPLATVLTLTLLRLLLIVLLAILFMQPALRWQSTRTSAGTVWVVVDQSPSMQTNDPQASPSERLHWAEGMGLITRKVRPDEFSALIHVLADELDGLTPDTSVGGGGDDRAAVEAFGERVDEWNSKLAKLIAQVNDMQGALNSAARNSGSDTEDHLRRALSLGKGNVSTLRRSRTLREARDQLQSFAIGAELREADKALAPAIQAADDAKLKDVRNTPEWQAVSNKLDSATRGDVALATLAGGDARAAEALKKLAEQYTVRFASFSDKSQSGGIADKSDLPETLKSCLTPSGQATNMGGALQYVAEQIAGSGDAASVIIIGDGRNNLGTDPTGPARNLASRGVKVYGLLFGAHELSPDAAVDPVDFPDWIFKGDSIRPRALIRLDGLTGQTAQLEVRRGGNVIESRGIRADSAHEMIPFEFSDTPPESEKAVEYEIRVAPMTGEVNTQNNVATFRVAIKKDKMYALIVEDRPRWEYRYLQAYLTRRSGMKVQTVLLQPAGVVGVASPPSTMAAPENPHTEAQILPVTLTDWQKFDVIILGDVPPEVLTGQMQQYIAATVRDKGATLITIAGQRSMPEKYVGSTLAELLPVTLDPQYTSDQISRHTRSGFRPEAAPTAGMSVLAQLGADASADGRAWQNMPPWYWHSPFTEVKPAATPIWAIGEGGVPSAGARGGVAAETGGTAAGTIADANHHALLSTITIGLGRSLLLSSDQTWRLRQVGGANLHDRFWGQVLNWAVGSDLPAGGKYVRFGANQTTYEQTQPVIITARILKDDLTPYVGLTFSALARPARGGAGGAENTTEARFEPMASPGYYQATLSNLPIGDDEITLRGAEVERLLNSDPSVTLRSLLVKVYPTMNAERRNMNTDPGMMEAIARAGSGFSMDGQYADQLLSRLPKIQHTEVSVYQLGFFTEPGARGTQLAHLLFAGVFLLIITAEWVIRKAAGLV